MAPVPTDDDAAGLRRLLGLPELAWLLARVRGRILEAGGAPLTGVVRLDAPTREQRIAAISLVGPAKRTGASLRIDLDAVEKILRRGPWPAGLADAVVTLTGPVIDRAAEQVRTRAEWEHVYGSLAEACRRFPSLDAWWREICGSGGLKRVARAEAARTGTSAGPGGAQKIVIDLSSVLRNLPESGVPLAVFARMVCGDAHGLDSNRPLGRLAATAVGVAFGAAGASPESRRDAWASAGVVLSNVSSTVLSLGVRGATSLGLDGLGTATARALDAMRSAQAPVWLTLDQVRSGGVVPLSPGAAVHVCENPTVVEVVASRWAERVAAGREFVLVCTSGQPSTAVVELVEILAAQGAQCRYHGDFDWPGLRIAQTLAARVPWVPWRFTTADYLEGLRRGDSTVRLSGRSAPAPWDPDLATTMAAESVAVEEEAVAGLLATDLVGDPE